MRYSTNGINYYEGIEVPVVIREEMYCDRNSIDRLRLVYIAKGSGMLQTPAGFTPFVAPALCCINERESIKLHATQKAETLELFFHPEFLNPSYNYQAIRLQPQVYLDGDPQEAAWLSPFLQRSDHYNGILSLNSGTAFHIDKLLRQIRKELADQRDWYWPCRTRSLLLELLLVIDRIYVEPITNEAIVISEEHKNINEIMLYLINNYQEKIQLSELTAKFNINRTSLNEYFKKATGYTVMSYLIQLRIHLAMAMLKDTALQVSEIMFRVGFVNPSHFIRTFKKITGMSPLEYRELHTWLYK